MADPFDTFKSLEKYYPGSKKKRGTMAAPETVTSEDWGESPTLKKLHGREIEMYTISALARAIGKSVHSVRFYETSGYIPKTPYRNPTRVVHGEERLGRRLYTREMISALRDSFEVRGLVEAPRIEWREHPELPQEIADKWAELREALINTDQKGQ